MVPNRHCSVVMEEIRLPLEKSAFNGAKDVVVLLSFKKVSSWKVNFEKLEVRETLKMKLDNKFPER